MGSIEKRFGISHLTSGILYLVTLKPIIMLKINSWCLPVILLKTIAFQLNLNLLMFVPFFYHFLFLCLLSIFVVYPILTEYLQTISKHFGEYICLFCCNVFFFLKHLLPCLPAFVNDFIFLYAIYKV